MSETCDMELRVAILETDLAAYKAAHAREHLLAAEVLASKEALLLTRLDGVDRAVEPMRAFQNRLLGIALFLAVIEGLVIALVVRK